MAIQTITTSALIERLSPTSQNLFFTVMEGEEVRGLEMGASYEALVSTHKKESTCYLKRAQVAEEALARLQGVLQQHEAAWSAKEKSDGARIVFLEQSMQKTQSSMASLETELQKVRQERDELRGKNRILEDGVRQGQVVAGQLKEVSLSLKMTQEWLKIAEDWIDKLQPRRPRTLADLPPQERQEIESSVAWSIYIQKNDAESEDDIPGFRRPSGPLPPPPLAAVQDRFESLEQWRLNQNFERRSRYVFHIL